MVFSGDPCQEDTCGKDLLICPQLGCLVPGNLTLQVGGSLKFETVKYKNIRIYLVPGGNKYRNLALQVGGTSDLRE
jgi:hypothetical protein